MTLKCPIRQLAASDCPVKSDHRALSENIPLLKEEKQEAFPVVLIWQVCNNPTICVITQGKNLESFWTSASAASPAATVKLALSSSLPFGNISGVVGRFKYLMFRFIAKC